MTDEDPTFKDAHMKDFTKVVTDFINDILNTFPELKEGLHESLVFVLENVGIVEGEFSEHIKIIRAHCASIYPERFFDILYQNEEIFDTETPLEFLPGINFNTIWKENISDNTKTTIWKYLQLILFTVVSDISDSSSFGDTAKLFEAINEDEFKTKLEETISQMQGCFDMGENVDMSGNAAESPEVNAGNLPDPNSIHEHLSGMMEGKLGKLAQEIAEETAKDLNMDMEDNSSVSEVFQTLFKNPSKLMGLVKKVGGKLDDKIKSGDINESELLAEAGEMVKKMKDMPGMDNIQSMLGNLGKNGKMNMGAMQAELEKKMRMAKQKERMRSKMNNKKQKNTNVDNDAVEAANAAAASFLRSEGLSEEGFENMIFSTGETYHKSSKLAEEAPNKKKKKKKKKKKGKSDK